jgi:hypothetical protein
MYAACVADLEAVAEVKSTTILTISSLRSNTKKKIDVVKSRQIYTWNSN